MKTCVADWSVVSSPDFWNTLLGSDFNRGYMAALALVLVLLVVLLVLRFIFFLSFRTRKCKVVTIPDSQGDITISRTAVENAVRNTFTAHPELELRELKLFRKGHTYMLRLHCALDGSQGSAFAALVDELRPALLEMLKETFGITNMRKIRFVLEEYEAAEAGISAPRNGDGEEEKSEENETDSGI